jgi:hypothetical protein
MRQSMLWPGPPVTVEAAQLGQGSSWKKYEGEKRWGRGKTGGKEVNEQQTRPDTSFFSVFSGERAGGLEDVDEGVLRSWVKQYSMR